MAGNVKDQMLDESLYGYANYEANGKPLFGKIYSYEDLCQLDLPGLVKKPRESTTPPEWPPDTVIDTSKWVSWLPEGWRQGVRTQAASGKSLKCYFSPEHKRFWHKKDIEKHLGRSLAEASFPGADTLEPGEKRVKYVTDPDVIPSWPEDDGVEWLPRDWRLCYRQLPTGPHKVYIPPGQDEGFLYQRALVAEYLAGTRANLSMFGTSKPMSEITENAATSGPRTRKRDRSVKKSSHDVRPKDYQKCESLVVVDMQGADNARQCLKAAGVPDSDIVSADCVKVQERLSQRSCDSTGLLYLYCSKDVVEKNKFAKLIGGIYYRLPGLYNERPYFQAVAPTSFSIGIFCKGSFIYWNPGTSEWRIASSLDPKNAGVARRREDTPRPPQRAGWNLLRQDFGADADAEPGALTEAEIAELEAMEEDKVTLAALVQGSAEPAKASSKSESKADAAKVEVKAEPESQGTKRKSKAEAPPAKRKAEPEPVIDGANAKWDGVLHTEKIWNYQEVQEAWKHIKKGEDFPTPPPHWPNSVYPAPGKWADWLPEGWGQCIKENPVNGRKDTKYVSPQGKTVWGKAEVEKAIGKKLESRTNGAPEWPSWLPKDWFRSQKISSATNQMKPIYIAPGLQRFCWTKYEAERIIMSGTVGKAGPVLKVANP